MATTEEIHKRDLDGIRKAYKKSNSWGDVVTSGYFNSDENESMKVFIDFVEDVYDTEIDTTQQLEGLTGISALLSKEPNIEKGEEPTLEEILIRARYSKYFSTLEDSIAKGGSYEDLLNIDPKDYKLPNEWKWMLGKNKKEAILWAISFGFLINEPIGLMRYPSLRLISKELNAPYSVIMEAYNITRY